MKPIVCKCGKPWCPTAIGFDSGSQVLLLQQKDGGESILYVTPDVLVDLIGNCREMLDAAVDKAGRPSA
jgi:hypothetical protein